MSKFKELTAEYNLLKTKLDKFNKFNKQKCDKMYIRHALRMIEFYCKVHIDDLKGVTQPKGFCFIECHKGKAVTIFCRGSIVYTGSIAYIKRWWGIKSQTNLINMQLDNLVDNQS